MTELLAGRYEVVKQLAKGGMGRVLLARDRHLDREVAIKTLLALDGGGQAQDRLLEEAQIGGQLVHPNILTVHELGKDGGQLFVVMKLVRGRDLRALVEDLAKGDAETREQYSSRRLLRIFLKICEAMAYAHERGVIHRDLKPANVMLDDRDEVLVMDWGLAKPVSSGPKGSRLTSSILSTTRELSADGEITQKGAILGTPVYMPIEQADGSKPLDARADVYSLGAILYNLVTRRPPYSGSAVQVVQALFKGPPRWPREVAPELSVAPAIESIVKKAMAREREGRYADAGALAADVAAYLDGRVPEAHRESFVEHAARVARQHALVLATAAVVLAATAVAGLLARAAVVREHAQATALADEATREDELARGERERARRSEQAAQAARAAAEAVHRAAAFSAESRKGVPVARLVEQHEAARAALDEAARPLRSLAAVAAEDSSAASLAEALGRARRSADLALAEMLVARSPALALDRLPTLEVGVEATLLRARALERDGRPAEAAKALAEASWPLDRADLASAARALAARLSSADDEVARWDEACAKAPLAGWVHLGRAEAHLARGELDLAERDYERAARLAPTDPYVLLSRIERAWPPGRDYVVSEGTVDLVRLLGPELARAGVLAELPKVWRGLAGVGDWPKDLDALGTSLGLRPVAAALHVCERARLCGKHDVVEEWARRALDRSPDDAGALGYLAESLLRRDRLDEAFATAERGLALAPGEARASFVRGEVARRRGDAGPRAIADLERGARGSMEPERWERLARALGESGEPADWERGVAAARRALSLDQIGEMHAKTLPFLPGEPALHRTLGRLRAKQGDHALAALHYARALVLSGFVPGGGLEDALLLGEAHEALGLAPEAAALYEMAQRDPRAKDEATRRLARLRR